MADVHLWACIRELPGREAFVVTASALPEPIGTADILDVQQHYAMSREEAEAIRDGALKILGAVARARGDRVVDVIDD